MCLASLVLAFSLIIEFDTPCLEFGKFKMTKLGHSWADSATSGSQSALPLTCPFTGKTMQVERAFLVLGAYFADLRFWSLSC